MYIDRIPLLIYLFYSGRLRLWHPVCFPVHLTQSDTWSFSIKRICSQAEYMYILSFKSRPLSERIESKTHLTQRYCLVNLFISLKKHCKNCKQSRPWSNCFCLLRTICLNSKLKYIMQGCSFPLAKITQNRLSDLEGPGPEVINLFSCSTQLSMNFVLLINLKLLTIANSFLLNQSRTWKLLLTFSYL